MTDKGRAAHQWLLSNNQKGIYYLQHLDPITRAFNIGVLVHLTTTPGHTLHPAYITSALRGLVTRHSSLRCSINPRTNSDLPVITCDGNLDNFQIATISTLEETDVRRWALDKLRQPYDFSKQLFRFSCHQTAPHQLSVCLGFHHIIADGTAIHTLILELLDLIAGYPIRPNPPQLLPTLSPYIPLSNNTSTEGVNVKTARNLTKKERIQQKWVGLLGEARTCTHFKRPNTNGSSSERASEWVSIKCAPFLTDVIHNVGKLYGVCPTVVMSSVYCMALQAFLKSKEILIGCAFMNRRRCEQSMVGHTVSLLPMRVDFSKVSELQDMFRQINDSWCLILEGNISLVDLQSVLPCLNTSSSQKCSSNGQDLSSSISRESPLQTIFSFLSAPQRQLPKSISLPDGTTVECRVEYPRSCDTHVDLFLEVRSPRNWDGEGSESSYLFTWEHRSCALSRYDITFLHNATISLLLTLQQNISRDRGPRGVSIKLDPLLKEMANSSRDVLLHSEAVVGSDQYTEKEMKPSVVDEKKGTSRLPGLWVWPNPVSPGNTDCQKLPTLVRPPQQLSIIEGLVLQKPLKLSFIERFMLKVQGVPNQLAFRCGVQTYTYNETMVMVDKLASVLIEEGVEPNDHVGLVLPHSAMLYVSLLAILRCSAAYVPISPTNPEERILNMLDLADSKLLITDTETYEKKTLTKYKGRCICIDSQNLHNFLTMNDDIPDLPLLYYHGYQIAYIIFTSGTTGKPKGVAITNDSLSHFLTNFLLLVTPHDTAVTLASCTVQWDGHVLDSLGPLLNGSCLVVTSPLDICEGITHAFMSPSTASVVTFPKSMRSLMVGGEAFTQTCFENSKSVPKLINVYGPTETTVFVSTDRVVGPDVKKYISNIGKPMSNVVMMVCDSTQQPVAVGTEGELCIAGPQVSRVGYYKNTEKTKAVFVSSPLTKYEMVYRTGDWTRMLPDGTILFLGRTDDQVKLRGMRFQLLEVENTLRGHPQVKMAAVIVRNPGTPSAHLLAFVTPKSVDINSLTKYAQTHLPAYMVPSSITSLDEMPLRQEGKVDRIALTNLSTPTPSDVTDMTDVGDVNINECGASPKLMQTAEKLAAIFGRVLHQNSYSLTSDFFTSGGQSLLLFCLLQQVKMELNCDIQLVDILQNPTPLSLATIISTKPHLSVKKAPQDDTQERACDNTLNSTTQDSDSQTVAVTAPGSIEDEGMTEVLNQSLEEERLAKSFTDGTEFKEAVVPQNPTEALADFDYLAPVPETLFTETLVKSLHTLFSGTKCRVSTEGLSKQIQAESGFHIPPAALEKYRDMKTLKTHLKLKSLLYFLANANVPLVQLHPPSIPATVPIMYIHAGIIGWAVSYIELARSIDECSFAVQRCEAAPTSSFEDMAAFYVKVIQSVQPKGPYRLVGVCYGAMLVYEIARQLTDAGQTIQLAVFVNHSPAIEKLPKLFNSEGEPLANTFVDPIIFFRKILGLPLATNTVKMAKEEKTRKLVSVKKERNGVGEKGEGEGKEGEGGKEEMKKAEDSLSNAVGEGSTGEKGVKLERKRKRRKMEPHLEHNLIEAVKRVKLELMVKSVVMDIRSSPDSSWIPFTNDELENVYLGFFRRLRCAWMGYKPRPGAAIKQCVLIRDSHHPMFDSHDYGLKALLPNTACLSVVTAPRKLGLLSDHTTFNFVRTTILLHNMFNE